MGQENKLPRMTAPGTGNSTLDGEHGVQLGLLEASLEAVANDRQAATEIVDQLYLYTQAHFLSEQLLMRLNAISNYEGHLAQHERLLLELDDVLSSLGRGQQEQAAAGLRSHRLRLLEHIRSWDRSVG